MASLVWPSVGPGWSPSPRNRADRRRQWPPRAAGLLLLGLRLALTFRAHGAPAADEVVDRTGSQGALCETRRRVQQVQVVVAVSRTKWRAQQDAERRGDGGRSRPGHFGSERSDRGKATGQRMGRATGAAAVVPPYPPGAPIRPAGGSLVPPGARTGPPQLILYAGCGWAWSRAAT